MGPRRVYWADGRWGGVTANTRQVRFPVWSLLRGGREDMSADTLALARVASLNRYEKRNAEKGDTRFPQKQNA